MFFDYKEILAIEDPVARDVAERAYKSMQADYTRKTQSIAENRKQLEAKLSESNTWTPEKINNLVKDPNFVSNLQTYYDSQANLPDDSFLSEEEKAINAKLQKMESILQEQQFQSQKQMIEKQDAELSIKYGNYDPQRINKLWNDMMSGTRQATREDFHKVLDYEDMANRAYELGLQDARKGSEVKSQFQTITNSSPNVVPNVDISKKAEGESNKDFLKRILFTRQGQAAKR
jgi:hypothetical protein